MSLIYKPDVIEGGHNCFIWNFAQFKTLLVSHNMLITHVHMSQLLIEINQS